jgi:LysM repeat protein
MAQGMFDACALDERINQKLKESIIKELCIQPKPEINSLDSLPPPEPNNVKPKPTPPKPKTRVYIVKSGDSLYKIAAKTGRTVQQLKTMNRIGSNNIIRPGQKIYY